MRIRIGFIGVLAAAILAGGAFTTLRPAFADEEDTYLAIEGVGAQDINGDGIATLSEGTFDIDGDGQFTSVEANSLGLQVFLAWDVTGGTGQWISGKKCMWVHIGNGVFSRRCRKQAGYQCKVIPTGYCTQ